MYPERDVDPAVPPTLPTTNYFHADVVRDGQCPGPPASVTSVSLGRSNSDMCQCRDCLAWSAVDYHKTSYGTGSYVESEVCSPTLSSQTRVSLPDGPTSATMAPIKHEPNGVCSEEDDDLDMIASLISKDSLFFKRDPDVPPDAVLRERRRSTFQHVHDANQPAITGLVSEPCSPNSESINALRAQQMQQVHHPHPIQAPQSHQMQQGTQQGHQGPQHGNGIFHGMHQPSVDLTGLLHQQFKNDTGFDMTNFLGMSQINGNLPTGHMTPMTLSFGHPQMVPHLAHQMHVPMPPSTSSAGGSGSEASQTSTTSSRTSSGKGKSRQRSSTGESLVKCPFCPKKFTLVQIDQHRNDCRIIRSHECGQCGKRFKARGGLQQHNRIHLQERAYTCRFCPKRFTQKSHLDQHERIHTGMKPFTCQYCGRCFRQRSQQLGHEATHPPGAVPVHASSSQQQNGVNSSLNSTTSSGIFSTNTTASDGSSISDQSCNASPLNPPTQVSLAHSLAMKQEPTDAVNTLQQVTVLSMLAPNGNPLSLKPETLELISGR